MTPPNICVERWAVVSSHTGPCIGTVVVGPSPDSIVLGPSNTSPTNDAVPHLASARSQQVTCMPNDAKTKSMRPKAAVRVEAAGSSRRKVAKISWYAGTLTSSRMSRRSRRARTAWTALPSS
eukprot:scaffold22014_cov123-Isochrysis_galbana.AAC.6